MDFLKFSRMSFDEFNLPLYAVEEILMNKETTVDTGRTSHADLPADDRYRGRT